MRWGQRSTSSQIDSMVFDLLPALHPKNPYSVVRIRVVRKWEYKGPTDNGPIQHVDLVLADEKSNAIYAEIPQQLIDRYNSQIQEHQFYEISRFRVIRAKNIFRAVDHAFMIEFTYHTRIAVAKNPPPGFPLIIYKLTPFQKLPLLVGNIKNFLDVLGIIVQIGAPETAYICNGQQQTIKRNIILRDYQNAEIRLTLWGQRASEFFVDHVYKPDEAKPVVTLFVGCLMKTFLSEDYLSGGSACKWYDPVVANWSLRLSRGSVSALRPKRKKYGGSHLKGNKMQNGHIQIHVNQPLEVTKPLEVNVSLELDWFLLLHGE